MNGAWIAVALVLHQVAAPDSPIAEVPARPAVTVRAGDLIPYDGVLLDDAATLKLGKHLMQCDAEVAALQDKTVISVPLLVGAIVGALAIGAAVGAGVAVAASHAQAK